MKLKTIAVMALLVLGATSCTEQSRSKQFGGTSTVDLPPNQKLVVATWKGEADLWYLTRPFREGEVPETSTFQENSSWGILEGTVHFKESKQ